MECLACHTPNVDGARFCAKCGAPLPINQSPEIDPLIGQTVGGRYRITGILGEGGMGRVFHGEQQMGTSVRRVAVKTLLSQFAKDPQTVARFMREVGTVSELEHPNTIKVYDFGQIDGSGDLYIAMELLTGETLEDAEKNGQPMAPERVDRILGQVCGSLQEAHDKGIVHRDLKPANIFLTTRAGEGDVVKVLDFGIAKKGESKDSKQGTQQQKLTQQGTILGTPPYMSPEQFTGKELDARSDLYSLAIVTYEMLTGRLPFEAETPWEWMNQHLSVQPFPFETIPAAANVPHKMRQGVMRALSKNRDERPNTAREFFEDISLGAVRMSQFGGSSSISSPNLEVLPPAGATGRGGQTQIGEPIFPGGAPMGAPGRTMAGEPYMPQQQQQQQQVPTAGGQAYPAPPPQKSGGGPNLALIGLLAFVVLGGGGGAAWYFTKGGGHKGGDGGDTIEIPTSKPKHDPDDDKKSSSSTGPAAPTNTADSSSSSGGGPEPKASGTPSAKPTAQPTTPSTGAVKTPPTKIDASCCNSAKGTKRTVCAKIIGGYNGGSGDRGSAISAANAQGGSCH